MRALLAAARGRRGDQGTSAAGVPNREWTEPPPNIAARALAAWRVWNPWRTLVWALGLTPFLVGFAGVFFLTRWIYASWADPCAMVAGREREVCGGASFAGVVTSWVLAVFVVGIACAALCEWGYNEGGFSRTWEELKRRAGELPCSVCGMHNGAHTERCGRHS